MVATGELDRSLILVARRELDRSDPTDRHFLLPRLLQSAAMLPRLVEKGWPMELVASRVVELIL